MSNHPFEPVNYNDPFSEENWLPDTDKDEKSAHHGQDSGEYVESALGPDVRSLILSLASPLQVDSLEKFSAWLKIPGSCLYLEMVCRALANYLNDVKEIAKIQEEPLPCFVGDGLDALTEILDSHINEWILNDCWSRSTRSNDPTHGIQSESQFYAALPYPVEFGKATSQHRQLSAHLIFAALSAWNAETKQYRHGLSGLLDNAAQAVRKLSSSDCISLLPDVPCSISAFRSALNHAIESKSTFLSGSKPGVQTKDVKHLQAVLDFLTSLDVEGDEEITLDVEWKSLAPDFTDSSCFMDYSTQISTSIADLREIRKSGLAIDEISTDVEYVIWHLDENRVQPDNPPKAPPTLSQQVLRRKHQIAAMERGAQILPIMWNRLKPHEVAEILESFVGLATNLSPRGGRQWKDDQAAIEAAVIALTSFWTARSLEESLGLILLKSRDNLPQNGRLPGITYILATDEWAIPVTGPKQSPKYQGADYSLAEGVSPILLLLAPTSLALFIRRLVSVSKEQLEETRYAALSPRSVLIDRIVACHENLKKTSAGRITPERIGETLFFQLYDRTRDIAAAALTTGHQHRLADTALHYSNANFEKLRSDYRRTCKKIEATAYEEIKIRRGTATNSPEKIKLPHFKDAAGSGDILFGPEYLDSGRVGAPICPQLETVKRLQLAIRIASNQVLEQPCKNGFLVNHHNLLVLYSVLMLKAGTGYRDIKSPIPRRSDLNLDDSTILVSDKDDASGFNTRVLPLVSPLREQWIALDLHVRAMASRLAITSPTIAAKIFRLHDLAPPRPKPKSERERNQQLKDKAITPLFFLEESNNELSILEIRPKILATQIALHAPWYLLPTNANRSRLRTYLLSHDCPADAADYLMGHWVRGQEPLGRFSALPLSRYLEILTPHLEMCLHEEGWTSLRGIT